MRRFFLTFKQQELEFQYQQEQLAQIKRPVYIFMIFASLFMNLGVLVTHFFMIPISTWYLNVIFAACCFIQIIIIIVKKKLQYLQLALTFTSISLGFLEFNVDPSSTTKSEFYSYGNVFMQLQVVLYFISDFPHAIIQSISHIVVRTAITIFLSSNIDYLVIVTGIISTILVLITIYVKDLNARKYYLLNLKEKYLINIAPFAIEKPFVRIILNPEQLQFQVTFDSQIDHFPGYNSELCNGCNVRNFLRDYQCENKLSLEQVLLKKDSLQLPSVFQIKYKKQKFTIKLFWVDVQQNTYILIFQQQVYRQTMNQKEEEGKLKQFLKQNNNLFHQKMIQWGVLSVLLLTSKTLSKVNLKKMLGRTMFIYSKKIFRNLDVKIHSEKVEYSIITYIHQLKIFLIQLFETIIVMQKYEKEQISIKLSRCQNSISIEVMVENKQKFYELLNNNYFMKQTSSLLIHQQDENFSSSEVISLQFKNYPISSFYPTRQ